MRTRSRFLITLAAVAAAGLVGCLNSPETAPSLSVPVSEAEIQAALSGDTLKPVRPVVCDTLKARLALLDSTSPGYAGLSIAVLRVCTARPDSLRPWPPRPDSLRPRPDSLRPFPDSLRPFPPKPPKPDSLPPLDPAAFCESLKVRLAALDTTSVEYKVLRLNVRYACAIPPVVVRPDSLWVRPDSLRPKPDTLWTRPDVPRPLPVPTACERLKLRLAGLDTTSFEYRGLSRNVQYVCAIPTWEPPKK